MADSSNILAGVTGGIAAYKMPGVIRRLREAGYGVKVVATETAFRFIPEETLAIAAGGSVHTDETWWGKIRPRGAREPGPLGGPGTHIPGNRRRDGPRRYWPR